MNKITLIFIITLSAVIICSHSIPTFAASAKVNGLEFTAINVHTTAPGGGEPSLLALDFVIYNTSETRKLDITKSPCFSLSDEFGNSYSSLPPTSDCHAELPTGQSVYPKQSYTTHLAFELPVSKATSATLHFDGSSLGIDVGQISIPLPMTQNDNNMAIRILVPENGIAVERGMMVHLNVIVTGTRPPDGIIIDAFEYTYEDRAPSLDNNFYDLNIPNNFLIGPQSINVIAKWKNYPNEDNITSSDSIIIYVRDASPAEVF